MGTPPGDLAQDSTTDRIGVVVDVPGDGVYSYHLRPPGGGEEWTAPRDGSTLCPAAGSLSEAEGGSRR